LAILAYNILKYIGQ